MTQHEWPLHRTATASYGSRASDRRRAEVDQFRSVDGAARIVNNLAVNAVGFGKDGLMVGCSSMAHAIK
jgi:hypothetical protein